MWRLGYVVKPKTAFLKNKFQCDKFVYVTDRLLFSVKEKVKCSIWVKLWTGISPAYCAGLNTVIHSGLPI